MNRLDDGRLVLPGKLLLKVVVMKLLLLEVRLRAIAKWKLRVMSKDSGCLDFFFSAWYIHGTHPTCCA